MVIHFYVIKEKKHLQVSEIQTWNICINFESNQHSEGFVCLFCLVWKAAVLTNLLIKHISAEDRGRKGERGRQMLHFSIGPESANFTMVYIKSKHAMFVLNLLLQYNNEVNSN